MKAVPELEVPNLTIVRNVQNPTISPGNVRTFDRIVSALG
jgi:hypothetical protein